jgi:hypothetical protein
MLRYRVWAVWSTRFCRNSSIEVSQSALDTWLGHVHQFLGSSLEAQTHYGNVCSVSETVFFAFFIKWYYCVRLLACSQVFFGCLVESLVGWCLSWTVGSVSACAEILKQSFTVLLEAPLPIINVHIYRFMSSIKRRSPEVVVGCLDVSTKCTCTG